MSDANPDGERLQETLEDHELAVKRTIESLGELQTELREVATDVDEGATERLADVGRQLEVHEDRLGAVVETLDEHKGVLREIDTTEGDALAQAMERARRRARQEPEPPTPHEYENS